MNKKILVIALALTLAFTAVGCSKDKDKNNTNENSIPEQNINNTSSQSNINKEENKKDDNTLVGTIDEIKDFMFVIKTDDDKYYPFPIEENSPFDIKAFSVGDKIVLKYEGEISEVDSFTGKIISVEKQGK